MYQYSYSDILSDSPMDARSHERDALDHAIRLLRAAASCAPRAPEEQAALTFTNQLWSILIKDLANPDNDLPAALRAQLISIGLWVMAEALRVEQGETRSFEAIADICGIVRDGLN